jgi:RNA polymerase sigma-70 factor (ECF subfamily)
MMGRSQFEALYQETIVPLRRYLSNMIGDRTMIDDITQEAYLRLLRRAPEKLATGQLKKYLFTTATNIVRDQWRKDKLQEDWSSAEYEKQVAPISFDYDIVANNIHLAATMSRLPIMSRSLLWLAYVEGFSHCDIASTMGIKTKSVKVMLFRARQSFITAYNELKSTYVEIQGCRKSAIVKKP